MKVLFLTRYSRQGASSRLRTYQYLPYFADADIDFDISPLFSDLYVSDLQFGKKNKGLVFFAYLKRFFLLLFRSRSYDLLWVEKELFPWVPGWVESLFLKYSRYVLDYDDAVFHYYDLHSSWGIRFLLGRKHICLMRQAEWVSVGNDYLANYALSAGSSKVSIVPTVVDVSRYEERLARDVSGDQVTVGWIGQRSTSKYLYPLAKIFNSTPLLKRVKFLAVGVDAKTLGLPFQSVEWSEDTEVESIRRFDIGVMPLDDDPFSKGKCGYKIIQYMACGVPVVASPVGVNSSIVEHGVNGFLAKNEEEWCKYLSLLVADADLRSRLGAAGRRKIEDAYSLQRVAPKLIDLIRESASS